MNPLVGTTPQTTATLVNFPPPLHLKHQAIHMVPYEPFDGPYIGDTDAKYLSVGLAQWRSPDDRDALSAKVWRYVAGKWSRMSEELPLHRVVDLCLLMVHCLFVSFGQTAVALPPGTFEGQGDVMQSRRLESYPDGFVSQARERVKARLRVLRDLLNTLDL